MNKKNARGGAAAALLFCLALFAASPGAATPGANTVAVYQAMERGRQALVAEKYVDAGKALDEALHDDGFSSLPQSDQFLALLFAGIAAQGREDYLGAHEYLVVATQFEDADADQWNMRARLAYWLDDWSDAGASLTTVAKRWPKAIGDLDNRMIGRTAYQMQQDPKLAAPRLDLLQALFEADFQLKWGADPSDLWQDLALDALKRGDLKRARLILKRIHDPSVLVRMRIDHRFDHLLEAEPKAFDVAAAAAAEARKWRDSSRANPHKLEPLVQYMYALFIVGDYQQVLELSDRTLAQNAKSTPEKPVFEDTAEQLNWIYDLRSQALCGLGRWDEALVAQAAASNQSDGSTDKVSQAINLGFSYNNLRRPEDALKALDGIDWGKSLSGYGRMQLQYVQFRAYLLLGKRGEAERIFAYMRENKADAQDTWQDAMLDWGDVDGAAAHLITRLHDPDERPAALYASQIFLQQPRLPQELEDAARWQALLARNDVAAAIREVGRIERQPIHQLME